MKKPSTERCWITATMPSSRRWGFLIAFALLSAAPAVADAAEPTVGSHISYSGDGLSCDTALVVKGAKDAPETARAQRDWMARNYPGARPLEKGFTRKNGRSYEVARMQPFEGDPVNLCFDVTEFIGD